MAGIVAAMAAAAVVGVIVASPATHHPQPRADTAAAVRLRAQRARAAEAQAAAAATAAGNRRVFELVKGLAVERNRSLTRVLNAKTARAQANAAADVGHDVRDGGPEGRAAGLPDRARPSAGRGPEHDGRDYSQLAAAGRANSQSHWNRTRRAIRSDEHALQREISRL